MLSARMRRSSPNPLFIKPKTENRKPRPVVHILRAPSSSVYAQLCFTCVGGHSIIKLTCLVCISSPLWTPWFDVISSIKIHSFVRNKSDDFGAGKSVGSLDW